MPGSLRYLWGRRRKQKLQGGVDMDIAGLSMNMAMMDVQSQVGIKMLSKAIDLGEELGAGVVDMVDAAALERSVNPAVGGNIDIRL